jgi:hypothetical protein
MLETLGVTFITAGGFALYFGFFALLAFIVCKMINKYIVNGRGYDKELYDRIDRLEKRVAELIQERQNNNAAEPSNRS